MKKLFLTLLVAVGSLTASAQVYVGGSVGFWRDTDANNTSLYIAPEVGYSLSDKWDLGLGLGYIYTYEGYETHAGDGIKGNAFVVEPYGRWNYAEFGPVSLFLDMGFGIATFKTKGIDDADTAWNIGVKPGLKVSLAKQIDFVAHLGFLGYRGSDDDLDIKVYGDDGFGFNFNSTSVTFGVYYNF